MWLSILLGYDAIKNLERMIPVKMRTIKMIGK